MVRCIDGNVSVFYADVLEFTWDVKFDEQTPKCIWEFVIEELYHCHKILLTKKAQSVERIGDRLRLSFYISSEEFSQIPRGLYYYRLVQSDIVRGAVEQKTVRPLRYFQVV